MILGCIQDDWHDFGMILVRFGDDFATTSAKFGDDFDMHV